MEDIIIYSIGPVCCSVCVDGSLSIKEITKLLNKTHPTGISSKWKLSKDETFRTGESNPHLCESVKERVHYLFNC